MPAGLAVMDWDTWVEAQPDYPGPLQRGGAMIYTSGTTGVPKGVRRGTPKPDMLAALDRVGALTYGLKADDNITVLMNGPMYHSAPYSYATMAWRNRCTIVLQPRFDPEDLLRLIEAHKVTHMHMVPTMFVRLLRLPDAVKRKYDLSSLRFIVHGAAPCPPAVKRAMIEWWGPVINEYYGSTETGIPVWHTSAEALAKPAPSAAPSPAASSASSTARDARSRRAKWAKSTSGRPTSPTSPITTTIRPVPKWSARAS